MMKIILFFGPNSCSHWWLACPVNFQCSTEPVHISLSHSNEFFLELWDFFVSFARTTLKSRSQSFFKFIGFHKPLALEPPNPFLASSILWIIFSLLKKKRNTEQKNGKYLIHLTVFVRVFRSIILTDADSNALIVRLGLCCIFLRACVGSPTLSSHTLPLF